MPTKLLKLSEIVTDAGTQSRAIITQDKVAEYVERMTEGDKFPPITLFHDGSEYFLADGFHRVMACERNGFKDVLAEVRKGTQRDALWFSLGANKEHGLPRTPGDKRHSVIRALRDFAEKSQREIALHVGCSLGWVNTVKSELFTTEQLPQTIAGKDGKTYPTKKTRKPPTPETRTQVQQEVGEIEKLAEIIREEKTTEPPTLKDLQIAFEESIQLLWVKAEAKTKRSFIAWLKG